MLRFWIWTFFVPFTSGSTQCVSSFTHQEFPIISSLSSTSQNKHKFVITRFYFGAHALFRAINNLILFQSTAESFNARVHDFLHCCSRYIARFEARSKKEIAFQLCFFSSTGIPTVLFLAVGSRKVLIPDGLTRYHYWLRVIHIIL